MYIHLALHLSGIFWDYLDQIRRNSGTSVREVTDFPGFLFQNVFGDCSVRSGARSNILTSVIKFHR